MVIIINNELLYFYNFKDPKMIIYDDNNYFLYKENIYQLYKLKDFNYNHINMYDNNFHKVIRNKFNNIVSIINNKYYVLLKVNIKKYNRLLTIDDLIVVSKKAYYSQYNKKDIFNLWKNKIDYLDNYYNKTYNLDNYDYNYFKGVGELALNLLKKINYSNITYGLSYNRFYDIKTLYDLYNPFIIKIGPIINSFSELIKYNFFYNNKRTNYIKVFELNLSNEDYYYFIARLIFPTYYYDLLREDKIKDYNNIINKIEGYNLYLKEVVLEIKKRHNDMSLLDYVINQL